MLSTRPRVHVTCHKTLCFGNIVCGGRMAFLFGGGAFATPVGQLVGKH